MPSRTKKIFIISSAVLIICLFFLGIYNFAFKQKTYKSQLPKKEMAKKEKPDEHPSQVIAKNQSYKIYPVTDEAALSPVVTEDGDHIRYYDKNNGHVYEILQKGGGKKTISDKDLPGLKNIIWSPNGNKVISLFEKGGVTELHYFDYATKTDVKLDPAMSNIAWTNIGDKILYQYKNPRNTSRTLSMADPDGKNWKNICDIPWQNVKIAPVPKSSQISFWNIPNSFEESVLKTVSIAGSDIKTIFKDRFGADYSWSPDGNRVLVSSVDTKGGGKTTLATINNNGGEYQNFNIPTLVNKSVWSKDGKTIYYALPGSIPEGSVMPNDYLNGSINTQDTFWKLNVATGKQERLVELKDITQSFDAVDLFLSQNEGVLYFINRLDGRLYAIDI